MTDKIVVSFKLSVQQPKPAPQCQQKPNQKPNITQTSAP